MEKYFGDWKARSEAGRDPPKPVPLNPPSYAVVPNAYASQDQVLMGQTLDLDLHDPDRYALELGNDVLGGNGFASRLTVDIRVTHGFAYGAGSGMTVRAARVPVLRAVRQRSGQGGPGGWAGDGEYEGDAETPVTEPNCAMRGSTRSARSRCRCPA